MGRPRLQYLKQVARNRGADSYTAMKRMPCNNSRWKSCQPIKRLEEEEEEEEEEKKEEEKKKKDDDDDGDDDSNNNIRGKNSIMLRLEHSLVRC